jgi:hypothetical protein
MFVDVVEWFKTSDLSPDTRKCARVRTPSSTKIIFLIDLKINNNN